jgi:hypothetical protein
VTIEFLKIELAIHSNSDHRHTKRKQSEIQTTTAARYVLVVQHTSDRMHLLCRLKFKRACVALVYLLTERAAANTPRTFYSQMPTSSNDKKDSSSSVLNEFKETIQKQKTEIALLKKQLQKSSSTTSGKSSGGGHGASHSNHHHHGSTGQNSLDDLAVYLLSPFYRIAFKRVGWLSLFLCSLSLTAVIINGFEKTLERQLELAYFVPLLAGHGGNTGELSVYEISDL